MSAQQDKVAIAAYELASCAGCLYGLLDYEPMAAITSHCRIVRFRLIGEGGEPAPAVIALVEGAVTCDEEVEFLHKVRNVTKLVVAVGACAVTGGIPGAAPPSMIARAQCGALGESIKHMNMRRPAPISSVIPVDVTVPWCPTIPEKVLRAIAQCLRGKNARPRGSTVCVECKQSGTRCHYDDKESDTICVGPITRGGCGALCTPHSGCWGCGDLADDVNIEGFVRAVARIRRVPPSEVKQRIALFKSPAVTEEPVV